MKTGLFKSTIKTPDPHGDGYVEPTIVGNLFFNTMLFRKKGDQIAGHSHPYDHRTFIISGSVKMGVRDQPEFDVCTALDLIVTPKGVLHWFEALEDNTIITCIHPIRNGEDLADIAPEHISEEEAKALLGQFPFVHDPRG
jgi:quercetin dioxygenase-like cupin family protein